MGGTSVYRGDSPRSEGRKTAFLRARIPVQEGGQVLSAASTAMWHGWAWGNPAGMGAAMDPSFASASAMTQLAPPLPAKSHWRPPKSGPRGRSSRAGTNHRRSGQTGSAVRRRRARTFWGRRVGRGVAEELLRNMTVTRNSEAANRGKDALEASSASRTRRLPFPARLGSNPG